jgi:hypothetical protein
LALVALGYGCEQSAPANLYEEKGDLYFSGYYFNYKNRLTPVGPGPNRFLGDSTAAWVDNQEKLHLKIQLKNGFWQCSEIISTKRFGYGTYQMTCETDIRNFDPMTVFGFFTWDDYSFQKAGNSEVDIEFAKWGDANDTLPVTYSVQPVIFSNPAPYAERTHKPFIPTKYNASACTYTMQWTPDSIVWKSYVGESVFGTQQISHHVFTKNNISRTKIEGSRFSDPMVIPAPGDSTNLRFNFWLLNGSAPKNGLTHEIIIKNFQYLPN